jgi:hypothetical protein
MLTLFAVRYGDEQGPVPARLSNAEFHESCGTDAKCAAALAALRWPGGRVPLPAMQCRQALSGPLLGRPHALSLYQCCGYQTSLTVGTVMDSTKPPANLILGWFLAGDLSDQPDQDEHFGISALSLKR